MICLEMVGSVRKYLPKPVLYGSEPRGHQAGFLRSHTYRSDTICWIFLFPNTSVIRSTCQKWFFLADFLTTWELLFLRVMSITFTSLGANGTIFHIYHAFGWSWNLVMLHSTRKFRLNSTPSMHHYLHYFNGNVAALSFQHLRTFTTLL